MTRTLPTKKPRAAKATVKESVARSIVQLPVLGARNPAAALLIGDFIDDWLQVPGDDGTVVAFRRRGESSTTAFALAVGRVPHRGRRARGCAA